ncbi:hypothetical protein BH11PSE11_BH11PSE11_00570 [soil metagenome]
MRKLGLAAHYQRMVEIDVCEPCSLIWFDDTESARLAGPGLLDLIRIIHGAMQGPRPMQPLPHGLQCPSCRSVLKQVSNVSRYGRTAQLECPQKHGALQSFALFLAEKGYFRPFSWADIKVLLDSGKRLSCFGCGANLDARPQDSCPYCKSPVGMIDPARLAKAIDVDRAAQALQLVATSKQAVCPGCGGGIDLSVDLVCPHCMAVVRPVETQGALAASEAVASQVRENYARQSEAVSRRKLEAGADSKPFEFEATRGESTRRRVIIALTLISLGIVFYRVSSSVAPMTHYEFDENNKKIGYTAAQFNAREKARRQAEMFKLAHAPSGTDPNELQATRSGNQFTITSRSNRKLRVAVKLAYEQFEDSWLRCDLFNASMERRTRDGQIMFNFSGESQVLVPSSCKDRILKDGKLEYAIWDVDRGAYIFKSDSAFFDQ